MRGVPASSVRRSALRAGLVLVCLLSVLTLACVPPFLLRSDGWRAARWLYPWVLALLALVPWVVWSMTLGADGRVPRLGLSTLAPLLTGPRGLRARLRDLPGVLRGAALTLMILCLARPQNVLRGETAIEQGIDIVVVLDVSGSMEATMGTKPNERGIRPTRLDVAKEVILDFIARRKTDRIGVVVFGRSAFVLSPPTLDYALLSGLVQKMELGLIDGGKTAIGDAIGVGVARLRKSNARSKAVVLLTDGENNAGQLDPDYATHLAQTQGVKIYTVQIGDGDWVDVYVGRDFFGQAQYQRQRYPVNPALLGRMASSTSGQSFVATDKVQLEKSMHSILDSLEKTKFEGMTQSMEDLFPLLLLPAVILVLLEALARVLLLRRFP